MIDSFTFIVSVINIYFLDEELIGKILIRVVTLYSNIMVRETTKLVPKNNEHVNMLTTLLIKNHLRSVFYQFMWNKVSNPDHISHKNW